MAEKKPKILVVDDDEMVRDFMMRALPRFGFEPVGVGSARRGLAVLRNNPDIAAVLLDWMMPEMDGIDFLIELRRTDTTTPVIMTTAKTSREDVIAAISAGVSDYIAKPIHLGKLVMKINAALSRQRPAVAPSVARGEGIVSHTAANENTSSPHQEPLNIEAKAIFPLLDVSESGCCIESNFPVPRDSVLFLDLPELADRIALPEEQCFPVRVTRCTQAGRRYRVGALFVGLGADVVHRLRCASISQGAFRYENR